jgi:hypothetical protein
MTHRLPFQLTARLAIAALFILGLPRLNAQSLVNDSGFGATVSAGVPGGVFGPVTYTRTQGPPDVYNDQFNAPMGGTNFTLWIKNGDTNEDGDPDHRVSSASLVVNGVTVVTPTEFNQTVDFIQKPVALLSGANTISAQINGQPGSFITVSIFGAPCPGDMTVGRLLTPWVVNPLSIKYEAGGSVRFALKNGSVNHARAVQAVFFNPDGTAACRSPRLLLAPHASREMALADLLGDCTTFSFGSVEFYWSGHGPARVFGTITRTYNNGETTALQLHMAGWHRHRMLPPPPATTAVAPTSEKSAPEPQRLDSQRKAY